MVEFPAESLCILMGACESEEIPEYETECEFCMILYQLIIDMLTFDATIE